MPATPDERRSAPCALSQTIRASLTQRWPLLRTHTLSWGSGQPGRGQGGPARALDRRSQSSAYMGTKVGCATAFSNTSRMVACSTSASATLPTSCSSSRSNFSGVSLFRMPLTALIACARPRRGPPPSEALAGATATLLYCAASLRVNEPTFRCAASLGVTEPTLARR